MRNYEGRTPLGSIVAHIEGAVRRLPRPPRPNGQRPPMQTVAQPPMQTAAQHPMETNRRPRGLPAPALPSNSETRGYEDPGGGDSEEVDPEWGEGIDDGSESEGDEASNKSVSEAEDDEEGEAGEGKERRRSTTMRKSASGLLFESTGAKILMTLPQGVGVLSGNLDVRPILVRLMRVCCSTQARQPG